VHWSLRERLSRIHGKNSKVDRNAEIEEKPQSLRHFISGFCLPLIDAEEYVLFLCARSSSLRVIVA
jgi:hypothetical protein